MIRRMQPTQARFVSTILYRQISEYPELRRAEMLANDATFVSSLGNTESKEGLLREMLTYLPLLNAKNVDLRPIYISLVCQVLKYVFETCGVHEDARQLLSYCLIHPAFTPEDRGMFSNMLREFDMKVASIYNREDTHYSTSLSGSPPAMGDVGWQQSGSPNNSGGSLSGSPGSQQGVLSTSLTGSSNLQRMRRSNSLTPPVIHSDAWATGDDLGVMKPRSLSLSSEVSPQGSLAGSGSGSESHLDDPRPTFTSPGMKDIPAWLKGLRLHKYSFLFAHLTFEEMMGLSEEMLDKQGVTKGARHKIILSINKLKDRPNQLKQLYDGMTDEKESVRNALTEIKWMLTTPIKPAKDEDAPSTETGQPSGNPNPPGPIGSSRPQQISEDTSASNNTELQATKENDDDLPEKVVNVIRKACELNPDSECEGLLVSILDKCLQHDAFTAKQKRLLSLWRQQQAPLARRNSNGHHSHFHGHHHKANSSPGSIGNGKHSRHFNPRTLNLPTGPGNWQNAGNSIHAMFMAKRPSLQDSILESVRNSHLSVQRTKSAPLPNFLASLSSSPPIFDALGGFSNPSDVLAGLSFATDSGFLNASISGGTGNDTHNPASSASTVQQSSAMDITSRLESLCLSMTEAALGPAFSSY